MWLWSEVFLREVSNGGRGVVLFATTDGVDGRDGVINNKFLFFQGD